MPGNRYLVYVRNFHEKPCPQVWQSLFYGVDGRLKERVAATHELSAEDRDLTIDQLTARYPAPVTERAIQ